MSLWKSTYQHPGMLWYSIILNHDVQYRPSTYNRPQILYHIIYQYMKNNKITVEESSRIPPTCFPASQMLDNIDNITFSSIWYILLNRINIEIQLTD